MGLFSKRPAQTPVNQQRQQDHRFNGAWFDNWWNTIIAESGVSPDDQQNRIQLIAFTHKLLDDSADSYFSQLNDGAAQRQYHSLAADSSSTLADKVDFLARWNPQVPALLDEKFTSFHGLLTRSGKQHGRLRFFPSDCCGEPLEIDPGTGARACSGCGRVSA